MNAMVLDAVRQFVKAMSLVAASQLGTWSSAGGHMRLVQVCVCPAAFATLIYRDAWSLSIPLPTMMRTVGLLKTMCTLLQSLHIQHPP